MKKKQRGREALMRAGDWGRLNVGPYRSGVLVRDNEVVVAFQGPGILSYADLTFSALEAREIARLLLEAAAILEAADPKEAPK